MSTSTAFDTLEIGDYFSIPGQPGILLKRIRYYSWGEGIVRGGNNYIVLKHPRKDSVGCAGYAMPDLSVVRERREKHLKRFSQLDVGRRVAFRDEPSTVVKKIRTRKVKKSGKLINAAVISTGIVRSRLTERSQRCPAGYLFIHPNEQLLVA